jgi:hypothetical protein
MQNKNDLGKSFSKLVASFTRKYNGVLCTKENHGWIAFGVWNRTWEETELFIDKKIMELSKTINNEKV